MHIYYLLNHIQSNASLDLTSSQDLDIEALPVVFVLFNRVFNSLRTSIFAECTSPLHHIPWCVLVTY